METLDRPVNNTHDAHKEFQSILNQIEKESLDILDRYPRSMSQPDYAQPQQYEELQANLDSLSEAIETLTSKCSLTTTLPDIQG